MNLNFLCHNQRKISIAIFFALFLMLFLGVMQEVFAATLPVCNFQKDLELGMVDEDVRCLQQYLNASGYLVAPSGVGSSGHETNIFGNLTKAAVIRWQRAKGLPGSGFFGPQSREQYKKEVYAHSLAPTTSSREVITYLQEQINQLRAYVAALQNKNQNSETTSNTNRKDLITKSDADTAINHAQDAINNAQNELDDFEVSDTEKASTIINNANEALDAAKKYYNKGDYANAFRVAWTIPDLTRQALDEIDYADAAIRKKAQSTIAAADNAIAIAESEIIKALNDGREIGDAKKILRDARSQYNNAQNLFDDKKYDQANAAAQNAINTTSNAISQIVY